MSASESHLHRALAGSHSPSLSNLSPPASFQKKRSGEATDSSATRKKKVWDHGDNSNEKPLEYVIGSDRPPKYSAESKIISTSSMLDSIPSPDITKSSDQLLNPKEFNADANEAHTTILSVKKSSTPLSPKLSQNSTAVGEPQQAASHTGSHRLPIEPSRWFASSPSSGSERAVVTKESAGVDKEWRSLFHGTCMIYWLVLLAGDSCIQRKTPASIFSRTGRNEFRIYTHLYNTTDSGIALSDSKFSQIRVNNFAPSRPATQLNAQRPYSSPGHFELLMRLRTSLQDLETVNRSDSASNNSIL